MTAFSDRLLKLARRKHGPDPCPKLAADIGVDKSQVYRWARGESVPNGWNMAATARALELTAREAGELLLLVGTDGA